MKVLKKEDLFSKNQIESAICYINPFSIIKFSFHYIVERRILKEAKHPFLARLKYAFQNEEKVFLVMDYIRGGF